jgi:DNA-binding HxlR family transcriptional regulator
MSIHSPPTINNITQPLNSVINIIGGKWRALIIFFLHDRLMRYSDLKKEIPNISQRMLSLDLRKLEKEGIVTRRVIDEKPIKVEYKLTVIGVELSKILHSLHAWEQKNMQSKLTGVNAEAI